MLFRFLILIFGIMFTYRIFQYGTPNRGAAHARTSLLTNSTILFLWLFATLSPWLPLFADLGLLFSYFLLLYQRHLFLNFVLKRQFKLNMISFIDELVLTMITGRSFKDSFHISTDQPRHFFYSKLKEIFILACETTASHPPHLDLEFQKFFELIQSINRNPHRALHKLKWFRSQLHWAHHFRQKVSQATGIVKIQALVLSFLYLGLLYLLLRMERTLPPHLIEISLAFYISGLISMIILARPPRWKS